MLRFFFILLFRNKSLYHLHIYFYGYNIFIIVHHVELIWILRVENIESCIAITAAETVHEEDSEQCRDEEGRYTDKHRENDLQDTAITRSKLSSDQIKMKAHPKKMRRILI